MGLANLFADGFSMAVGNYLAQKSYNQFIDRELNDSLAQIKADDDQISHMISRSYRRQGFSGHTLRHILHDLRRHPKIYAQEALTAQKLATQPRHPVTSSLVTFIAFVLIGLMPILPILLIPQLNFWSTFGFIALVLFLVGSLRSYISLVTWYRGGLEIMLAGLGASLIAFTIGSILSQLV